MRIGDAELAFVTLVLIAGKFSSREFAGIALFTFKKQPTHNLAGDGRSRVGITKVCPQAIEWRCVQAQLGAANVRSGQLHRKYDRRLKQLFIVNRILDVLDVMHYAQLQALPQLLLKAELVLVLP